MATQNAFKSLSNLQGDKKLVQKKNYYFVDKFIAGLSLVAFVVIILAGLRQGANVVTITFRAMITILILVVVKVIVIKILMNYEELSK